MVCVDNKEDKGIIYMSDTDKKTIYDIMGKSFLTVDLKRTPMGLRRFGLERGRVGDKYVFEIDEVSSKFISFKLVKIDG